MSDIDTTSSLSAAPINQYSRYIGAVYAIYLRELDHIKLADEFRYERFIEKTDAYKALADRGTMINQYLILEEYSILDI